jgi:hypothetical protein
MHWESVRLDGHYSEHQQHCVMTQLNTHRLDYPQTIITIRYVSTHTTRTVFWVSTQYMHTDYAHHGDETNTHKTWISQLLPECEKRCSKRDLREERTTQTQAYTTHIHNTTFTVHLPLSLSHTHIYYSLSPLCIYILCITLLILRLNSYITVSFWSLFCFCLPPPLSTVRFLF